MAGVPDANASTTGRPERDAVTEQSFRALVEAVEDYAIFQLTPDGTIATWNTGAARIKGWPQEEVIGRHYRIFFTAADAARGAPERNLAEARRLGRASGTGTRVRRDGTVFVCDWVLTAIYDGGELVGFAKVTHDVTAEREAREALARSAAELAEANRALADASRVQEDILAVAHHELRTPLTTIIGFAQTLQTAWDRLDEDQRRSALRAIEAGGRRLHGMVENLLALTALHSVIQPVADEPVSVGEAIAAALETSAAPRGDVSVTCDPGLAVRGDPMRLRQMIANLLTNAVIYGSPPIEVQAHAVGRRGRIVVADAGRGVDPAFVPHLFERFSQASRGTTRTARGTGLGLATVLELAKAQRGSAWYEPNAPTGARFIVDLPLGGPGQ
ncbi:MAG TPA: PAS domain-containing sensor histidine kinase [Acidimicrobiales bacterium]|nr:PAS domain-containing sensor histidine kinase [Acidimicrobiales bacterium]